MQRIKLHTEARRLFFISLMRVLNTVCLYLVETDNQQAILNGLGVLCVNGEENLSLASMG